MHQDGRGFPGCAICSGGVSLVEATQPPQNLLVGKGVSGQQRWRAFHRPGHSGSKRGVGWGLWDTLLPLPLDQLGISFFDNGGKFQAWQGRRAPATAVCHWQRPLQIPFVTMGLPDSPTPPRKGVSPQRLPGQGSHLLIGWGARHPAAAVPPVLGSKPRALLLPLFRAH